jgi:hypothetical protein
MVVFLVGNLCAEAIEAAKSHASLSLICQENEFGCLETLFQRRGFEPIPSLFLFKLMSKVSLALGGSRMLNMIGR